MYVYMYIFAQVDIDSLENLYDNNDIYYISS